MKKLALFVEGKTEQLFALRLLQEMAGRHRLSYRVDQGSGGATECRCWQQVLVGGPPAPEFFVLVYNCGNDSRVLSDICEQYQSLKRAGYSCVVGLSDLYPQPPSALDERRRLIKEHLKRTGVLAQLVIAVREIEAWFLAEERHYAKVHEGLDDRVVASVLGSPVAECGVEHVAHPSEKLDEVYRRVGLSYLKGDGRKTGAKIARTVEALDIENLVVSVAPRVSALQEFCGAVEEFLTMHPASLGS